MSITSRCTECGAESSGSGGIVHATTCSAVSLTPKLQYGQMAPAIELKFGSNAERKKFMKNISSGKAIGNQSYISLEQGSDLVAPEPLATTDTASPPSPATIDIDKAILSEIFEGHHTGECALLCGCWVAEAKAQIADLITEKENSVLEKLSRMAETHETPIYGVTNRQIRELQATLKSKGRDNE